MTNLTLYKCKGCGHLYYPERNRCYKCRSKEFEKIESVETGRLLTYTKLYTVPEGVAEIPLVLGVVEFEGSVRALGQITHQDVEQGMQMQVGYGVLRKVNGREVSGIKFTPLR